mgnify:CR=1 FL=1
MDDSVYEYEKAIIDDLKQEDVSRYVDVDEETYEEVKKKKHHIVPIVILVLVFFDCACRSDPLQRQVIFGEFCKMH